MGVYNIFMLQYIPFMHFNQIYIFPTSFFPLNAFEPMTKLGITTLENTIITKYCHTDFSYGLV